MKRRGFLESISSAALLAAAGAKDVMAQSASSDSDVEKRLNTQLDELITIARKMPELKGVAIPAITVKSVKHTKQKFSDIEIMAAGGARGAATFVLSRDILERLDKPERQMALVAHALSEHLLKLYPNELKEAGITAYAKPMLGRGANLGEIEKNSLGAFILPLRIDEIAVKMMEQSPNVGNGARQYYFMLVGRKQEENERSEEFFQRRGNAPAPETPPKSNRTQVKTAKSARAAVEELMKINGQTIGFSGGQFSASVPVGYDKRLEQIQEMHPRASEVSSQELNPRPAGRNR